jgi:hypothetical protein
MFTPGSKYFLGLTGVSLVSAILYMILVNPSDLGVIALFGVVVTSATIGGFSLFTRDATPATADDAAEASAPSPVPSFWPIVFALGAAVVLLGMATNSIVFVLGIAVLAAGGVEWVIQDWAERASSDTSYNAFARARAIGSIEYPGLAAVGLGVIAFLFSRVMLTVSKSTAPVIFIVVAALVVVVGTAISSKPAMRGKNTVRVAVASVLLLSVAGVVSAISGERHELAKAAEEKHYDASNRECGAEESEHYDHLANNKVALKSAVVATIFVEDGKLHAQEIGIKKDVDTITIPRSNATTIMFRNLDEGEYRLVVDMGERKVGTTDVMEKVGTCTQLTGKGQENALTITASKPSPLDKPFTFTVPGVSGEIKLVVP